MEYKSSLTIRYLTKSDDIEKEQSEVGKIAFNFWLWRNCRSGGNLQLRTHTEAAFTMLTMNTREKPRKIHR